jgi:nucleoside-triphosphatase
MTKNILITGVQQSGKSTLLENVLLQYPFRTGLVTKEIRDDDRVRVGFEMETHGGDRGILAHTNFDTPHRISKYVVDLTDLEHLIPKISGFSAGDILYLDEIGQMQLLSDDFRRLVMRYLDAENIFVGTLSAVHHDDFTDSIRKRADVIIVEISKDTRQEKEQFVSQLIRKIEKARNYVLQSDKFHRTGDDVKLESEHGIRLLTKDKAGWGCNCHFYSDHGICSHVMATREFYKD